MNSNGKLQMCNFMVHDRPFSIWDMDLSGRNMKSIRSISPEFFEYIANIHSEKLDTEDKQMAALAIRMAYHHSLEVLFSLLFATLQAPACIYGWLLKYQIRDIKELLNDVKIKGFSSYQNPFYEKDISSWEDFSGLVFHCNENSKHKELAIQFGKLWRRLGVEFMNNSHHDEYNGIKHGYRCKPGGFRLAIGLEAERGKPCPKEEMKFLGGSDFGTTFYVAEKFGEPMKKDPNFKTSEHNLNWNAKANAHALVLISMSMLNIRSFLLSINGSKEDIEYVFPEDILYFNEPWENRPNIPNFHFDLKFDEEKIRKNNPNEILENLRYAKRDSGDSTN